MHRLTKEDGNYCKISKVCWPFVCGALVTCMVVQCVPRLHVISFSTYNIRLKRRAVISFNKRRPYMKPSPPSGDKCWIYGREIASRQSHFIRLEISLINYIWQELSLIQVSTSYPKRLMLIARLPLTIQFSNHKVKKP